MDRKRRSRTARLVLLWTAALIVLGSFGAGIYVIFAFFAGSNVENELSKLRAKGEPVTIDEVAPPEVSDNENGALIYAKAFKLLPLGESNREFLKLSDFVDDKTHARDLKAEARRLLAKHSKALELAEWAAAKPKCRFPVKWEQGWEADTPHYKSLRKLSNLAAAKAIIAAHEGRMDEALNSVVLGIRMADAVKGEPTVLAFLVRNGLVRTPLKALNEAMQSGDLPESRSGQLDALLARIDLVEEGVSALRGERANAICMIEHFMDKQPKAAGGQPSLDQADRDAITKSPIGGVVKTIFRRDEAFYLRRMNSYMDHAREPYRVAQRNRKLAFVCDEDVPRFAVFSRMFLPVLGHLLKPRDEAIATISASRILLALRLHRQRKGSYPSTLSELGGKLAEDPFSGKAFVYKRKGPGIILYSIGPDLKDNGGVARKRLKGTRPSQVPPGDLVWRLER